MIYTPNTQSAQILQAPEKPSDSAGFQMKSGQNSRMGGSVPVFSLPSPGGANSSPRNEVRDSFGFLDFLDMVNPLQHIPIVSSIYRSLTGDEIGPVAQITGGAVYGGPLGAAIGMVNAVISQETGHDAGMAALELFSHSPPTQNLEGSTIAVANLAYPHTRTAYNS